MLPSCDRPKYARLAYLGRRETEGTPTVTVHCSENGSVFLDAVRCHKSQHPAYHPAEFQPAMLYRFQNGASVSQTDRRQTDTSVAYDRPLY